MSCCICISLYIDQWSETNRRKLNKITDALQVAGMIADSLFSFSEINIYALVGLGNAIVISVDQISVVIHSTCLVKLQYFFCL